MVYLHHYRFVVRFSTGINGLLFDSLGGIISVAMALQVPYIRSFLPFLIYRLAPALLLLVIYVGCRKLKNYTIKEATLSFRA